MKEAEEGNELKGYKMRKQLKYMTNKYRRQIFRINDTLNTTVPNTIMHQAQIAES